MQSSFGGPGMMMLGSEASQIPQVNAIASVAPNVMTNSSVSTIKEQNTELQSKITALDVQYQRLMEQVEQQSSLLEAELQRNEKL